MDTKRAVWFGSIVGSFVGGLVPNLWGAGGFLTFSGVFCEAIGAVVGIYIAFKISRDLI